MVGHFILQANHASTKPQAKVVEFCSQVMHRRSARQAAK